MVILFINVGNVPLLKKKFALRIYPKIYIETSYDNQTRSVDI